MKYRIRFDNRDAGTIEKVGTVWYAYSFISKERILFLEHSGALMYLYSEWEKALNLPWDES